VNEESQDMYPCLKKPEDRCKSEYTHNYVNKNILFIFVKRGKAQLVCSQDK